MGKPRSRSKSNIDSSVQTRQRSNLFAGASVTVLVGICAVLFGVFRVRNDAFHDLSTKTKIPYAVQSEKGGSGGEMETLVKDLLRLLSIAVAAVFEAHSIDAPATRSWLETFVSTVAMSIFEVQLEPQAESQSKGWVQQLWRQFPEDDTALMLRRHSEDWHASINENKLENSDSAWLMRNSTVLLSRNS